jgi:excisionase family DNA binding protein
MKTETTAPRLAYGIADAVQATSVGRSLLYEEIRAGKLKTFKVGSRTLIAADDLTAWLAVYRSASR